MMATWFIHISQATNSCNGMNIWPLTSMHCCGWLWWLFFGVFLLSALFPPQTLFFFEPQLAIMVSKLTADLCAFLHNVSDGQVQRNYFLCISSSTLCLILECSKAIECRKRVFFWCKCNKNWSKIIVCTPESCYSPVNVIGDGLTQPRIHTQLVFSAT